MTERLYYTDSYLTSFSATLHTVSDDGLRIQLDRTAFYPTSGGQPHDTGTIANCRVIDVIDDESPEGQITHVLESPCTLSPGVLVHGTIDQGRRFDHMQQHTGQHLLSALFADHYGWPTVSVHFGDVSSTIDVQGTEINSVLLQDAETRANAQLVENREVSVTFEDALTATRLRKPSDRSGSLRIVTIAGIDRSACGGTHVRRTGEIGGISLRRAERTKGHTRIEFLCGMRAITRARADATLLTMAARVFTAAPDDLPALVEKQQQRATDLDRETRRLTAELAGYKARSQWDSAPVDAQGLRRVRIALASGAVRDAEPLAQALIALGACVVLVTTVAPAGILFATSADANIDAGQTLRAALASVDGRGGGSPRVAQGSVPEFSHLDIVAAALGFL